MPKGTVSVLLTVLLLAVAVCGGAGEVPSGDAQSPALPCWTCWQASPAPGQRLGLVQHLDPGAGANGGEAQRNQGHTQAIGDADFGGLPVSHELTIDATGCQKEIAQTILVCGTGYVLTVKQNQGRLFEDLKDLLEEARATGFEGVPHD